MHVHDAHEIEVSWNGVLQTGGGETEIERRLVVEPGLQTVQDASRKGISTADSIDDAADTVRARASQTRARHQLGGKVVMPLQQLPDGDVMAIILDVEGIPVGIFKPAAV